MGTNITKEELSKVCCRIAEILSDSRDEDSAKKNKEKAYAEEYRKRLPHELEALWAKGKNLELEQWEKLDLILSLYTVISEFNNAIFRNTKENERKKLQEMRNELQKSLKKLENTVEFGGWYHLLLGTVYYGQAMIKNEQYISAAVELSKANTHFERGVAELTTETQNEYQEILYCLLLLNRAKYFIALVMDSKQKHNTRLLRALSLLNTVEEKTKQENRDNKKTYCVLKKIYWAACITDIRIRRMLAVWNSPSKNRQIQDVHGYTFDQKGFMKRCTDLMDKLIQMHDKNSEKQRRNICIQILLHVGLYYRETVLFPQSSLGKQRLETAVGIFFAIELMSKIWTIPVEANDDQGNSRLKKIVEICDPGINLQIIWDKLGFNALICGEKSEENEENKKSDKCHIDILCDYITSSTIEDKPIGNQDATNNIAACLKKLQKDKAAEELFNKLKRERRNKYAEYQSMKFYFARHTVEERELLGKLLGREKSKDEDFGTKVSSNEMRELQRSENSENANIGMDVSDNETQEQRQRVLSNLSGFSRQWLFLYGRYLQRYNRHEEAQKIFRFLYQNAPIVWNSLEVKAVYLDADSYMLQEQFSKALELLDRLHDSISRVSAGELEIRTEIDRGWCMLRLCRYEEALEVYSNLLSYICNTQKCNPALLSLSRMLASKTGKTDSGTTVNRSIIGSTAESVSDSIDAVPLTRILNNIYLCWPQACSDDTKDGELISDSGNEGSQPHILNNYYFYLQQTCSHEAKQGKLNSNFAAETKSEESVWDSIDKVHQERILNNIYLCLLYIYPEDAEKVNNCYKDLPRDWKKLLKAVFLNEPERTDLGDWSGYLRGNQTNYLAFRYFLIFMCKNIGEESAKEEYESLLTNYLLYTAEPIDLNTYTQIAKAFQFEKERDNTKSNRTLCSLFCHAKLTPTGVNQAFMKLMENESFRQIDIVTRTQILARIIYVYEAIVEIKKKCAVSYTDYKKIEHIYKYMKLSSLKHFLTLNAAVDAHPEEARLRISNICHMNDLLEGNAFINYYCQADETKKNNLVEFTGNYECHGQNAVIPIFQSDVFVGCFTNRDDNFGMWNGYAEESKGCLVEIDPSYFDFTAVGNASPDIWGEDLGENTLYKVQYVRKTDEGYKLMDETNNAMDDAMKKLDKRLQELSQQIEKCPQGSHEVIHNFVADRINEIRYLFKTADYAYEEEYRILRCSQSAQINMNGRDGLPYIYIDVDRKLKIKSIQVGSNATLQQFMLISAWAKNCEGSPKVTWSDLNRRVLP